MSVTAKINKALLGWSKDALYPWQHEALRRILAKGTLSEQDKADIYERAQFDLGFTPPPPNLPNILLTEADLPTSMAQANRIWLAGIKDLENVNALKAKQRLVVGKQLTLVYGENGSGKSGYARVLKKTARCTEKAIESILPDVFTVAAVPAPPKAVFELDHGAGPVDVPGRMANQSWRKTGIRRFVEWVEKIQHPVVEEKPTRLRPPFPGFEAAFGIPFSPKPLVQVEFNEAELMKHVLIGDRFKRTYQTAGFFTERILEAIRTEEDKPTLWFIIAPEDVYKYCRPAQSVGKELRIEAEGTMRPSEAHRLQKQPALFGAWNEAAVPYQYDPDFRNQIKGRLLSQKVLTQVIRESTLAHREFLNKAGKPTRQLDKLQSEIAWNLGSAIYYKVGGRPWKLNGVRKGVCYVGLAYKRDEKNADPQAACCAAQMFLDSGDGVVFKGNVGAVGQPCDGNPKSGYVVYDMDANTVELRRPDAAARRPYPQL